MPFEGGNITNEIQHTKKVHTVCAMKPLLILDSAFCSFRCLLRDGRGVVLYL